MAPSTFSGRIVKTRKSKKSGTAHQRNHRWESFTVKISKLNSLDAVRKVRRHDIDPEDLSTTTSYFKAGLEKWAELSVSQEFIAFSHEVLPLSDSLPQILHFEEKIMGILVTYLEKKERDIIQPLLELMTDFAHDLGARFEKHYAKALELVTAMAGTPLDEEIIEWSFTCLAFLFKYLSKLLVPDLRPTYDLMAPLMGKDRVPPHIARFAAEAMSFLVKKAAAPAHRQTALPLIISHAKKDLRSIADTRQSGLYYHGIMTLFAEAMKGNGLNVHTGGPAIFHSLFIELDESDFENGSQWTNVICGVLTSMVHHTSSETFKDIEDTVMEQSNHMAKSFTADPTLPKLWLLLLSARTIGIMAGVRKGSRISNWSAVLEALSAILRSISMNPLVLNANCTELDIWEQLILSVSIALQYTPMDAMIPFIAAFMEALTKEPLAKYFLTFCTYFSEAAEGPERFLNIVLPYFKRFVLAHWSDTDNGDTLCVLLPKMVSSEVLPSNYGKNGFTLPQSWQDQIVSKFEGLEVKPFPEQVSAALYDPDPQKWVDRCLPKYKALLEVLECTTVHPSTNARIAEILLRKLKLALRPDFSAAPEEAHFIVGRGFSAVLKMSHGLGAVDGSLRPLLHAKVSDYGRLPDFLQALLTYEKATPASELKPTSKDVSSPFETREDSLINPLISNLSTNSPKLRLLSLRLLEHFYNTDRPSVSEALSLMITVEQTPLDLQTARSASMHIRKLAVLYSQESTQSWIRQAIPAFCFGMFTIKYAQIWDDAATTLTRITESQDGEKMVAELAFKWLQQPSWRASGRKVDSQQINGLTDFECSNLMKLDQLARNAASSVLKSRDTMLQNFATAQQLIDGTPSSARAQALHVLSAVPSVAEKRSRILVPMFLSWANKDGDDDDDMKPDDQSDHNACTPNSNWSRKDQKSLLELFGKFSNSRSLFKSQEVHDALLHLLANGDLEIQRSALKAIFAWKSSSIKPYEENLLNLLDEARFKDEVAILLQGQTLVQREHRAELMPVLLRTLYGRAISRRGVASGRQGPEARRLTVLRHLSTEDFGPFLGISLGDLKDVHLIKDGKVQESILEKPVMRVEKLIGFINMMEVVLKELGTKVVPFMPMLVEAALYCLVYSSRQLDKTADDNEGKSQPGSLGRFKDVRQTGLKCLVLLFANSDNSDWLPYLNVIVQEVINPRIESLPIESAEGISGMLRLFHAWSSSSRTVKIFETRMLCRIADCLTPPKTKPEVKLFVLAIIKNLVKNGGNVTDVVLSPNIEYFLVRIGGLLQSQSQPTPDLLESCIEVVSQFTPFINTSTQAKTLVEISILLLDRPRLSHRVKSKILVILEHFVPLHDLQNDPELRDSVYSTVSSLFGYFKDTPSREVLSRVLMVYSKADPILIEVADICMDLNALKDGRLEEPDYDRCSRAFTAMRGRNVPFTPRQWTPLLYNMLYYIKDEEAFSIMSMGASDSIKSFIDNAALAEEASGKAEFQDMISKILIPALYSGVRGVWSKEKWMTSPETVRQEYVKTMGHLVKMFPDWPEVSDMHMLLASDDELESSFFNNILTVGKGKQSSALGQLSVAAETGLISSKHISQFFIPLVENFILDRAEGSDGHNLAAETTTTIGVLAGSLEWPQYRAVLRRFIGYLRDMPQLGKQIIKLLGRVIDALALAADSDKRIILAVTMPKELKLATDLTTNILPPLTDYLHEKDESAVSLRVPVAIIVVRLLKLLPQEQFNERLPPVLTDICHILRSKSQEARDMTRETLVEICVLLGPSCFGFVLKELRGALVKGYQLHVLSYTMHSILVDTTPKYAPGDLDYCLPTIVAIIMDDIFGATGQEKDAEEYTSNMKEVKSSKSHDSMELIAKTATLSHLIHLVRPIQALLKEKLNIKMVRKIDELLNRISAGLLRNSAAQSRDSLIFCYEVIQDASKLASSEVKEKADPRLKKYLILKGARKSGERGSTTIYTYKLVRFGFDVLRAVLTKYDNLRTSSNLAQFVPMAANAVVEAEEEVRISVFRLLATISKVTLKGAIDGPVLYRIAAEEATKCISQSSSTSSDIAQASLYLLSVVLRDRHDVTVKDTAVDSVLTKLRDDITQFERRHVTFKFLRAVLDSKVQTATVYDTLDYVREVMVTNDDKDTRDLARGSYFQFLCEYEQKKKRWTKQLDFLSSNLSYPREGGRLQILEVVHLLLSKSSNDYIQEVAARFFPHLVLVIANDESEKCRILAGELIKKIFGKADKERTSSFLKVLRPLVERGDTRTMVPAFKIYGYYYEVETLDNSDVSMLLDSIYSAISEVPDNSDVERTLGALELTAVLMTAFSETMISQAASRIWTVVTNCVSYPNARIKLSSAKLLRAYLIDFAQTNASSKFVGLPLKGSRGLELTGDNVNDLLRRSANIFRTPDLRLELAQEATQILGFLGIMAGANNLIWKPQQEQDEESDNELEHEERPEKRSSLQYLFGRLSYTLRQETSPPRASTLIPKTTTLNLIKALCGKLPTSSLLPSLETIILPLHNLTDTSIPIPYSTDEQFKIDYETLRTTSQALLESLKEKFGVEIFSSTIQAVRDGVRNRRNARSSKRKIEAVNMPERHGEQKRKKGERKRERRKEKGQEHSQRRKELM